MPPASIAVILNHTAGTAKRQSRIDDEIARLFRAAGCNPEMIALRAGENPADVARAASARASIVVAAGGDGTVSAVAAGIDGTSAALGILPLGTLNHFAKDLHIPPDLSEAVAVVAAGHIERVDVGTVNHRLFTNNSSIGIYPGIVQAREELRRRGHRKWPAMAIATLQLLKRYDGVTVSIDVNGQRRTWRTLFVFVGNNEYAIDGIRFGARARLDEGKLFVYLSPHARARHLPVLLAQALLGRARQSGQFEIVAATELWIESATTTRMRVALDGEVTTLSTPLHYRVAARALPVVRPHT
jgi:diacylglycerol kinase family enzyme